MRFLELFDWCDMRWEERRGNETECFYFPIVWDKFSINWLIVCLIACLIDWFASLVFVIWLNWVKSKTCEKKYDEWAWRSKWSSDSRIKPEASHTQSENHATRPINLHSFNTHAILLFILHHQQNLDSHFISQSSFSIFHKLS